MAQNPYRNQDGFNCNRNKGRFQGEMHLQVEEQEVLDALRKAGYVYHGHDEDEHGKPAFQEYEANFIPTDTLYRVYREYIAGKQWRGWEQGVVPCDLTRRQFGAVLRYVYDMDYPCHSPVTRVRKRYHGKLKWGYPYFTGPDVLTLPLGGRCPKRGRPPKDW